MGMSSYFLSLKSNTLTSFAGSGATVIFAPFGFATAIATDLIVMLSLIFLLRNNRSGFSKTNRLINTLIFYSVQIGSITVGADIVILVMNQFINKIAFDYVGVYEIVGNLYANSLLASLNARTSLRANTAGSHVHMSTWGPNTADGSQNGSQSQVPSSQRTQNASTIQFTTLKTTDSCAPQFSHKDLAGSNFSKPFDEGVHVV